MNRISTTAEPAQILSKLVALIAFIAVNTFHEDLRFQKVLVKISLLPLALYIGDPDMICLREFGLGFRRGEFGAQSSECEGQVQVG
jgi:hypothetical protein